MTTEKAQRLKNRLCRGILTDTWLDIKIQSIKEGCHTIGEYIEKVHREHIERKGG